MKLADLQSDFAVLDDWEDRYRYIIELGRTLPPMAPELKNETTKVRGCASQVWLVSEPQASGTMHFVGESDAHIVQGLIAILFSIYEGKSPREILSLDPAHRVRRARPQGALDAAALQRPRLHGRAHPHRCAHSGSARKLSSQASPLSISGR